MDKELLQAISDLMDSKLLPINERFDSIQKDVSVLKEDVAMLKEDTTVIRSAVNTLLEWAEDAQVHVKIPLFKKAE